jgi:hypothetical protein
LQPDGARPGRDRLVDVRAGLIGAAEDIDHIELARGGDLGHGRVAALAEDLLDCGVHWDHAEAAALEHACDAV